MISELINQINKSVFDSQNQTPETVWRLVKQATGDIQNLLEIHRRERIEEGMVPLTIAATRLHMLYSELPRTPDHRLSELLLEVAFVLNELRVKFNKPSELRRGQLRAA